MMKLEGSSALQCTGRVLNWEEHSSNRLVARANPRYPSPSEEEGQFWNILKIPSRSWEILEKREREPCWGSSYTDGGSSEQKHLSVHNQPFLAMSQSYVNSVFSNKLWIVLVSFVNIIELKQEVEIWILDTNSNFWCNSGPVISILQTLFFISTK